MQFKCFMILNSRSHCDVRSVVSCNGYTDDNSSYAAPLNEHLMAIDVVKVV
jgi:hypothetical protein